MSESRRTNSTASIILLSSPKVKEARRKSSLDVAVSQNVGKRERDQP
jgi:hypothetical protein